MTKFFPQREANNITVVLRAAGAAEFPVDVMTVAKEISKAKYPDEPITVIKGAQLPGFEGALSPAPAGKTGWGIFYNSAVNSRGRINFTLAHEFGHYLLHRKAYPDGFECSTEDMARWESEFGQRENEANVFAATLLMPLDDFRDQIDSSDRPTFDELGNCDKIVPGHDIDNRLGHILYKPEITVGHYAHKFHVFVNHRNAPNTVFLHDCKCIICLGILTQGYRVKDHSIFCSLYFPHFNGLVLYAHVLMDDTNAAFLGQGNR